MFLLIDCDFSIRTVSYPSGCLLYPSPLHYEGSDRFALEIRNGSSDNWRCNVKPISLIGEFQVILWNFRCRTFRLIVKVGKILFFLTWSKDNKFLIESVKHWYYKNQLRNSIQHIIQRTIKTTLWHCHNAQRSRSIALSTCDKSDAGHFTVELRNGEK